jgi:hypothetical protein
MPDPSIRARLSRSLLRRLVTCPTLTIEMSERRVLVFGVLVLPKSSGCNEVRDILKKMAEGRMMGSTQRRRKEYMTAAQCRLLRIKAHEKGYHSMALAQAVAFELV